jgi:NitT/TauT family transport system substrate-binding protein
MFEARREPVRFGLCIVSLVLAGCVRSKETAVRIITLAGVTEFFPVFLAQELGHFREEQVPVSLDAVGTGSKAVQAVLGGGADVVYSAYVQTVQMTAEGRPMRSFYVSSVLPMVVLVVAPAKAERLRRIEDLKGALIGVSGFGTPQHQYLAYLLQRHGLTAKDVSVAAYGNGPSAVASLERSKMDAGVITGGAFEVLKRRAQSVRVLADPRTREGMNAEYGFDSWAQACLFSRMTWLGRNHEQAIRLTRAMNRTSAWIRSHSVEEILQRLPANFRTADEEADLSLFRQHKEAISADGRMPVGAPENAMKVLAVSNEKVNSVNLSITWTNEFVEVK